MLQYDFQTAPLHTWGSAYSDGDAARRRDINNDKQLAWYRFAVLFLFLLVSCLGCPRSIFNAPYLHIYCLHLAFLIIIPTANKGRREIGYVDVRAKYSAVSKRRMAALSLARGQVLLSGIANCTAVTSVLLDSLPAKFTFSPDCLEQCQLYCLLHINVKRLGRASHCGILSQKNFIWVNSVYTLVEIGWSCFCFRCFRKPWSKLTQQTWNKACPNVCVHKKLCQVMLAHIVNDKV